MLVSLLAIQSILSLRFQTAHKNNLRKELIGRLDPREERPYERRKRQLPERRCVSLEAAVGYLLLEGSFLRARARIVVGTGLRNRRKKTTSPVPMRREEQRRNRKVKGMFWASLHFSSKGHFFSHKLATSSTFTIHSRACLEVSLADGRSLPIPSPRPSAHLFLTVNSRAHR